MTTEQLEARALELARERPGALTYGDLRRELDLDGPSAYVLVRGLVQAGRLRVEHTGGVHAEG